MQVLQLRRIYSIMGVHGLWQLLKPTGSPVTLESMSGKILAIDVSLWLHQSSKGLRDRKGEVVANAHLILLFRRLCKLLYYGVKPVFVFDGGVPALKRQTILGRRMRREEAATKAEKAAKELLTKMLEKAAVEQVLNQSRQPSNAAAVEAALRNEAAGSSRVKTDMFELDPLPAVDETRCDSDGVMYMLESDYSSSDSDVGGDEYLIDTVGGGVEDQWEESMGSAEGLIDRLERRPEDEWEERLLRRTTLQSQFGDLTNVDVESSEFISLPAEMKHEILSELKEIRKKTKWAKIDQLPKDSEQFSKYQVERMMKDNKLTRQLDSVRQELRGGDVTGRCGGMGEGVVASRIISEDDTHYILISGGGKTGGGRTGGGIKRDVRGREKGEGRWKGNRLTNPDDVFITAEAAWKTRRNGEGGAGRIDRRFLLKKGKAGEGMNEENLSDLEEEGGNREGESSHQNSAVSVGQVQDCGEINRTSDDLKLGNVNKSRHCRDVDELSVYNDTRTAASNNVLSKSNSETAILNSPLNNLTSYRELVKSLANKLQSYSSNSNTGADQKQSIDNSKSKPDLANTISDINSKNTCNIVTSASSSRVSSSDSVSGSLLEDNDAELQAAIALSLQCIPDSVNSTEASINELNSISSLSRKNDVNIVASTSNNGDPSISTHNDQTVLNYMKTSGVTSDVGNDEKYLHDADVEIIKSNQNESEDVEPSDSDSDDDGSFIEVESVSPEALFTAYLKSVTERKATTSAENSSRQNLVGDDTASSCSNKSDSASVEKSFTSDSTPAAAAVTTKAITVSAAVAEVKADELTANLAAEAAVVATEQPEAEDSQTGSVLVPGRLQDAESQRNEGGENATNKRITKDELLEMGRELERETGVLKAEKTRQDRLALSITDQMHAEAQELLRLFGVPYMTSPMEAEAQCAHLDLTNQTDGCVTDDSDIWVFGGRRVYRNMFNQSQHVEFYTSDNINSQLYLDQAGLINLALLCGSDYTEGVQGVGPVTALEILAEFSAEGINTLINFRDWWKKNKNSSLVSNITRNKWKNLVLREGFPNEAVVDAYLHPTVDESAEKFTWAKPDLDLLRKFAVEKLNWSKNQADDLLLPLFKKINSNDVQLSITSFFPQVHTNGNAGNVKMLGSQRIKKVLEKMSAGSSTNRGKVTPGVAVKGKRGKKLNETGGGGSQMEGGFIRSQSPQHQSKSADQGALNLSEDDSESD